jgi:hypothetical protein
MLTGSLLTIPIALGLYYALRPRADLARLKRFGEPGDGRNVTQGEPRKLPEAVLLRYRSDRGSVAFSGGRARIRGLGKATRSHRTLLNIEGPQLQN